MWEPEHVISLLNKYRGLLFTQKYKGKKTEIPFAYYQRLKVYLNTNDTSEKPLYYSDKVLPSILDTTNIWQYNFLSDTLLSSKNINFINPQRFKDVGYNKWIKNQAYITIDLDNKMYAKNPLGDITSLIHFDPDLPPGTILINYDTILDNPIDGYRFNDDNSLDVLDFKFPCEESLIQPIIDLCLKELGVANNQSKDMSNNAVDDFSLPKQQQ